MIDILYVFALLVTGTGIIFIALLGLWHLVELLSRLTKRDKDE